MKTRITLAILTVVALLCSVATAASAWDRRLMRLVPRPQIGALRLEDASGLLLEDGNAILGDYK
jgi:hypothetical protein